MVFMKMTSIRTLALIGALVVLFSCVPVLPAAAAEEPVYELSGMWEFNDVVAAPDASLLKQYILFSYDTSFPPDADHWISSIAVPKTSEGTFVTYQLFTSSAQVQAYQVSSWSDDTCRDINFGPTPQVVSAEFYEWFTASATPVDKVRICGLWTMDEVLSLPASPVEYTAVWTIPGRTDLGLFIKIRLTSSTVTFIKSNGTEVVVYDNGWVDEAYRIRDFGDDGRTFASEFVTWYKDNASTQSAVLSLDGHCVHSHTEAWEIAQSSFHSDLYVLSNVFKLSCQCGFFYYWRMPDTTIGFIDNEDHYVFDGDDIEWPIYLGLADLIPWVSSDGDQGSGDQAVLQAGQWECKSLVMTGEYVDLSPWPEAFGPVSMNFVSGGRSFSSMSGQYHVSYGDCLFYDNYLVYKYSDLTGTADPSWQGQSFAQVYLNSDQEVPQVFYDWFVGNFERTGSDPVLPTYLTTVNIYDPTGITLLHCVQFTGTDSAPIPSLIFDSIGCTIYCGDQYSNWVSPYDYYYGFNFSPGLSSSMFQEGILYNLPGGGQSDVVVNLYVVDDAPISGNPEGPGVAGDPNISMLPQLFGPFFAPVQYFFSIEFVPGFSFGRLIAISIVLGLVFWFLKVSKS